MGGVQERTEFAALLAQTIREVADELQGIIERQQEAKEVIRERGRQKPEADSSKAEKIQEMLEDLFRAGF